MGLAEEVAGLANVACACDPDESRRRRAQEKVHARHAVADLRRVLDDRAVDAVVIATPEHWHAPAAILACDAGKHVYVEKSCSRNVREGRLLVEAARRNNRLVQHGTQSRRNPFIAGAIQMSRRRDRRRGRAMRALGISVLFTAFGGSYPAVGATCGLIYALGLIAICWAPDTTGRQLKDGSLTTVHEAHGTRTRCGWNKP